MATQIETMDIVIDKLQALYTPAQPPKMRDGTPNPKFGAYAEAYVESLSEFAAVDLKAGMRLLVKTHRYSRWPTPGEIYKCCLVAQQDRTNEEEHQTRLRSPSQPKIEEGRTFSQEHKIMMADRMQRISRSLSSGMDMHSDSTRDFVYNG